MLKLYSTYLKRPFDLVVCLVALPLASGPMLIVALLIKVSSKGPIIFKQTRIGRNNEPFTIYKFRSMPVNAAPNVSAARRKKDEARHIAEPTRVGKFLRATSLDELPQLINVLIGDMSVVGPRPVIPEEKKLTKERMRLGALSVRPGLTGLAQINGRNDLGFMEKAAYDAEYVINLSLREDAYIMIRSALIVLSRTGNQDAVREGRRRISISALVSRQHRE